MPDDAKAPYVMLNHLQHQQIDTEVERKLFHHESGNASRQLSPTAFACVCDTCFYFVLLVGGESDEESEKAVREILQEKLIEWKDKSVVQATLAKELDKLKI